MPPPLDLTPFGFTPTESVVYAALLRLGPATGYAVAHATRRARANTYGALEGLVGRPARRAPGGGPRASEPRAQGRRPAGRARDPQPRRGTRRRESHHAARGAGGTPRRRRHRSRSVAVHAPRVAARHRSGGGRPAGGGRRAS